MSEQQSEYKIGDKVIIDSSANSFNGSFGVVAEVHEMNDESYYLVAADGFARGALGSYPARDLRRAPVTVAPADALFVKVGGAYFAINQIDTIRGTRWDGVKVLMGEQTVHFSDPDQASRLLEWAERNAIDLGG